MSEENERLLTSNTITLNILTSKNKSKILQNVDIEWTRAELCDAVSKLIKSKGIVVLKTHSKNT